MKFKPDEYYNNGQFEIARFGEKISLHNIMTLEQNKKYIEKLKADYFPIKTEVNELVKSLQQKIISCNPIQLLTFASHCSLLSVSSHTSEFDVKRDEIPITRMTEYIQSVLVASQSQYMPVDDEATPDPSDIFFSIKKDIEKLYSLIYSFYGCMFAKLGEMFPNWDNTMLEEAFEAQTLFLVRGQRYQVFEVEYFRNLLQVHNDIFLELYDLNATQIIQGIANLQYALSQGKANTINRMHHLMENIENGILDEACLDEECKIIFGELLDTRLHNVTQITGWSPKLIRELSYKLGEETDFFSDCNFAGWPIIDLPIQKRPFINIEDKYYCFDYYSFMDNIYRSIQKATTRLAPNYRWADAQQVASEKMVENIFHELLPECHTYLDNYYPIGNSLKQTAENDLIVIYSNTLFIVEIKAGSFVYTAPIADFEAHIKSYKTLIEKADWQCKRTYDYLVSDETPILYCEDKTIKTKLSMQQIEDIYMISVTVDNINDFAAKAEKLSFLNLKCNAISISVDDLMVYREYFKSPLIFLHFLKHRQLSTQEEKLILNDELDHLGMYIKHNYYSFQVSDNPNNTRQVFYGYRQKLDEYFCSLYHPELNIEKPNPNIPGLFLEIINYLEVNKIYGREKIANYMLDFSTEAKNEFCDAVASIIKQQSQTKQMCSFHAAGSSSSLRYTCYINQPQVNPLSETEKEKYVLASIVHNKEPNRVMIDLYFDSQARFSKIKASFYSEKDIADEETKEHLRKQGQHIAQIRIEKYRKTHPGKSGKIGRNQLCPCGSGKKYKQCCGNN